MAQRIGIYAGTFDPVHSGHIAFALQAVAAAQLDRLYFLPERRPRHKQGVQHFAHRLAMIKQALKPYPQFDVLDLPDVSFSVRHTLPRLRKQFGRGQLVFLMGSDIADHLPDWPHADQLLKECELVIGVRAGQSVEQLKHQIEQWPLDTKAVTVFESFAPDVSSRQVREALRQRQSGRGLLASVQKYSNQHWLYVSLN